ncbi:MAG: hypothetical protein ACREAZ_11140 [Nitrososphaera sp.]
MVEDTEEEKLFRARYAFELRKKKVYTSENPSIGIDELSDELKQVKRQAQITPGRKGEQIKYEEISKEILRRISKNKTQDG